MPMMRERTLCFGSKNQGCVSGREGLIDLVHKEVLIALEPPYYTYYILVRTVLYIAKGGK